MGQRKGTPTPTVQQQAYMDKYGESAARTNSGTTPAMINSTTTFNALVDATFATDADVAAVNATLAGIVTKFAAASPAAATGTVNYNCSGGTKVFRHANAAAANWTANFQNLTLDATSVNEVKIIASNGDTEFAPTAVQVNGVSKTFLKTYTKGKKNKTNIFTFTILDNSSNIYADISNDFS